MMNQPYKGLNPYEEPDKDNFFGRTSDIRILSDKIRARKLTFLFAASGVGKSSLLQAGVMPELKQPTRKHYKPLDVIYYRDWVLNPLETFVKKAIEDLKAQGKLSPTYELERFESLKAFLQFCTLFSSDPLVVIFDQFEEFFYYQRFNNKQREHFVEELSAAIHDEDTTTAFVISMREDSALELNAFKTHIPTFLIENFYRLEKLTKDQANEAIVKPVARLGFAYEPELLALLLQDLGQREWRDRHGEQEAFPSDAPLLIEAPHLQIICEQLWALDGTRTDKKEITLATYQREGRTEGLLKKYFYGIVGGFSWQERKLASLAFTLLVSRYGTKLARPLSELARSSRQDDQVLDQVLRKLDDRRILRRQNRQGQYWYELYHDVLAKHVYDWNEGYKRRQFIKRSLLTLAAVGVSFVGLVVGVDYYQNTTQVHFRLSPKSGISDVVEVYRGKLGSFDWLSQQEYRYEMDYLRQDIEADQFFNQQPVIKMAELNNELVIRVPLKNKVREYIENGEFGKAFCLAQAVFTKNRGWAIDAVSSFRTNSGVKWLEQQYQQETDNIWKEQIKQRLQPLQKDSKRSSDKKPEIKNNCLASLVEKGLDFESQSNNDLTSENTVESVIKLLKNADSSIVESAIESLECLGNSKAVIPLVKLSTDKAAKIAGKLANSDPGVIGRLARLTKYTRFGVAVNNMRISAIKALGYSGCSEAVQPLIALLQEKDPLLRANAAFALGILKNVESVEPLIGLLKDENPDVRSSVAKALGLLGNTKFLVLPFLITLLEDENPSVRSNVAQILGKLKSTEAIQPLINLLKDKDGGVRWSAKTALEQLNSTESVQPLVALLKDESSEIRSSVAQILGELKNAEATQPLISLLEDETPDVRKSAIESLEKLESVEAVKPLITLVKDEDSNVRSSVARALGQLGNAEAIQPLIALLDDDSSDVRSSTARTLGQLGAIEVVQSLIPLLKENSSYMANIDTTNKGSFVRMAKVEGNASVLLAEDDEWPTMLHDFMVIGATTGGITAKSSGYLSGGPQTAGCDVAEALGRLKSVEATSYLIDSFEEDHFWCSSSEAQKALEQLGILTVTQKVGSPPRKQELETNHLDSLLKSLIKSENINIQRKAIRELEETLATNHLPPSIHPKLGEEEDTFGHPSTLKPLEILATPTTIAPPYQGGVGVVAKTEIQTKLAEIIQNPQTIFGVRADALRAIAQLRTEEVAQLIIKTLQQAKKDADTNLNQKYFILNALQALGINGHKIALPLLQQELADLTQQKQHWRKQRDTETAPLATPEFTCNDDQKPSENTDDKGQWPKASWEIVLGQAIARVDPENAGLKLLRHDLTNVRQGARFGLAQVATAPLVEKLHQQREHSKSDPNDLDEVMFVHSAYRALDDMLIALEEIGTQQDYQHLKTLLSQIQAKKGEKAKDNPVYQRIKWTIGQLEYQY